MNQSKPRYIPKALAKDITNYLGRVAAEPILDMLEMSFIRQRAIDEGWIEE